MEIELQPAGRLRDESGTSLIGPATVINYGLSEDWEAVFEGQGQTPLSPPGPTSLTAAGAFLKHVLVPAACRTKPAQASRPSWRPTSGQHGNSGVGASLAGIVSQRWDWGTIISTRRLPSRAIIMAISSSVPLSKDRRHGQFAPLARIFYENEFGKERTFSGLVGLIYRVRDNLSFDVAIRSCAHGWTPGERDSRGRDLRLSALFFRKSRRATRKHRTACLDSWSPPCR